jgi:hypothetical protein
MTPLSTEQARVIRTWRVDLGCSWGRVKELFVKAYPDSGLVHPDGGQLCQWAASILGEQPGEEPWN